MKIADLTQKVYEKLSDKDFSASDEKVAIQFNVTGEHEGVFYVEIFHGVLSVMPYEYIDHDAVVTASAELYNSLLDGEEKIYAAFAARKLSVEGNVDKVLLLDALLNK